VLVKKGVTAIAQDMETPSSKLETMAFHRDFPTAVAAAFFLVLLLTEPCTPSDDEVVVGTLAIVITWPRLHLISIIHHDSSLNLVRIDPSERSVNFAWGFATPLPRLVTRCVDDYRSGDRRTALRRAAFFRHLGIVCGDSCRILRILFLDYGDRRFSIRV